jgi:hypothetical protein
MIDQASMTNKFRSRKRFRTRIDICQHKTGLLRHEARQSDAANLAIGGPVNFCITPAFNVPRRNAQTLPLGLRAGSIRAKLDVRIIP